MIDVLKTSLAIKPAECENEFVVEQVTNLKVEDDVNLSETAQTVAEVQSAIEQYEEASDSHGPLPPSEAAVKIVKEQFGIPVPKNGKPVQR